MPSWGRVGAWLGGNRVGVAPGSLPSGEVARVAGGAGSMRVVLRGPVCPVASAEAGQAWHSQVSTPLCLLRKCGLGL